MVLNDLPYGCYMLHVYSDLCSLFVKNVELLFAIRPV